ncbi:alpha/beta hydrolase [Rhodococcus pseudokoreensis]|uniref:Alpha/beta hydrolase n=1 Tax=Rhodococcus pseudokoreensis TaxID=2811421 RepID=A0A974ZUK4_9NOCA|nr:alpha/beta hydrolase [Rhodococcus pseudokoreensis]QSE90791.1 alpha/beta hydrolase [Rhodococcus pseudokoreensis]
MVSPQAKAINERLSAYRTTLVERGWVPTLEDLRKRSLSNARLATEPTGIRTTEVTAGIAPALLHEPEGGGSGWVYLHCHGGGLVTGTSAGWSRLLGHLALRSGWPVLNLDYRLAPENPHPAGLEDAMAAFRWLEAQGYPADQIVVGGDSAGSSLALGTVQRLRDKGICGGGCVLLSPCVDFTLTNPSIKARAEADISSTPEMLDLTRNLYVGDRDAFDPQISPGLAAMDGLPPLHIEVSQQDILFDDATNLAERASKSGVDVDLKVWDEVPHVHQLYAGNMPEADESIGLVAEWLGSRKAAKEASRMSAP